MVPNPANDGVARFQSIVDQLGPLMEHLLAFEVCNRLDVRLREVPGIYSFWERDEPLYIGRTNTIRTRVQSHSQPSSGHNSATFAFLLAMERANALPTPLQRMTRSAREKDETFKALFSAEKTRVAQMKIRVVEISDPNTQAIFEVYAAMILGARYNDFNTH
jgi:hypothetical protein